MTDLATLGIEVDTSTVPGATRQLDALGDQAEVTQNQAGGMQRGFSSAANAARLLGVSSQQAQQGMRMLPFQLNQMAQMGAVTGNWMQAISIQLPDILQGFGAMRLVMAGTAVGLGAAFVPALIRSFDETAKLEAQVEKAAEALAVFTSSAAQLERIRDLAVSPIEDLRQEFGVFAEQVQETAQVVFQAALGEAMIAYEEASAGLQEGLRSVSSEAVAYQRALTALDTATAALGERTARNQGAFAQFERSVAEARAEMDDAASAIGLGALEAVQLDRALRDLAGAQSMEQVAKQAGDALDLIQSMYPAGQRIPPEVAAIVSELRAVQTAAAAGVTAFEDMGDAISGAADQAARLARNVEMARRGAAMIENPDFADPRNESGTRGRIGIPGSGSRNPSLDDYIREVEDRWRERDRQSIRRGGSSSQQERAARAVEQWIRRTETATESYRREVEALLALKPIFDEENPEAFARAMDMLNEEFRAVQLEPFVQGIDSISGAMANAIIQGEDMGAAMKRVFSQIAADLLASGISRLLTGAAMSAFPGVFSVPSYAGGTSFHPGGLARINDGGGGEILNLPRGTQVIPHDVSMEMARGSGPVNINVNVSGARGNAEITEMVSAGVSQGLASYDAQMPRRVRTINRENVLRYD